MIILVPCVKACKSVKASIDSAVGWRKALHSAMHTFIGEQRLVEFSSKKVILPKMALKWR